MGFGWGLGVLKFGWLNSEIIVKFLVRNRLTRPLFQADKKPKNKCKIGAGMVQFYG